MAGVQIMIDIRIHIVAIIIFTPKKMLVEAVYHFIMLYPKTIGFGSWQAYFGER